MSSRPSRFCALVLLACWQVLLASADDFNLARFLFCPAESESEDLLPPDDPNEDFTQPPEARAPENSGRGGDENPATSSLPSAMSRNRPTASLSAGQVSLLSLNTPLRC